MIYYEVVSTPSNGHKYQTIYGKTAEKELALRKKKGHKAEIIIKSTEGQRIV